MFRLYLGNLEVLFLFPHAEDYLHTSSALFKCQVPVQTLTGSGVWERGPCHAWTVELEKSYE